MTGNIRRKGSDCMERQKYYICIDLKSFYASVECVERNLDPFQTNLVVADSYKVKIYHLPGNHTCNEEAGSKKPMQDP